MSEPKYTPTKGNESKLLFTGTSSKPQFTGKQFKPTPGPSNGVSGGKPKYT